MTPSFEQVLKLYHLAQRHLAEVLAAFEVMDVAGLSAVGKLQPYSTESPEQTFTTPTSFAVLVETRGANEEHDTCKLLDFLEIAATTEQLATDTKIAANSAQNAELWRVREELPVNLAQLGTIFKFDLCFPLNQFNISVEFTRELLKKRVPEAYARGEIVVTGFGHFGDGNVHLNIVVKKGSPQETLDAVKSFLKAEIYDFAAKNGASISAEHGIGEQKFDLLKQVKQPEVMQVMELLKKSLDPNGILNPYKVVDAFGN
jgi:FAD/FMN-containing dehydrogenase